MSYPPEYVPATYLEQAKCLKEWRSKARQVKRLLSIVYDPSQTQLSPGYEVVLNTMLESYRASIKRVMNIKAFNSRRTKT